MAKKINGIIAWHVGDQKWVVDLKQGKVYEGAFALHILSQGSSKRSAPVVVSDDQLFAFAAEKSASG